MSLYLRVNGIKDLNATLSRLSADAERMIADAVSDEANEIRDDERRMVPVATGELRSGIRARESGHLEAEIGIWDRALYWAPWIEWGRSNAAAQPFATPAAQRAKKRWPKRAGRAIVKAVKHG